jgi:hypothetical protein
VLGRRTIERRCAKDREKDEPRRHEGHEEKDYLTQSHRERETRQTIQTDTMRRIYPRT